MTCWFESTHKSIHIKQYVLTCTNTFSYRHLDIFYNLCSIRGKVSFNGLKNIQYSFSVLHEICLTMWYFISPSQPPDGEKKIFAIQLWLLYRIPNLIAKFRIVSSFNINMNILDNFYSNAELVNQPSPDVCEKPFYSMDWEHQYTIIIFNFWSFL